MLIDERGEDRGRHGRKPWFQRYLGLILFILATILSFTVSLVNTWADANTALNMARENHSVLKESAPIVGSVPHLEERLKDHVADFKDYKLEQRSQNASMNEKLDYIIRRGEKK